MSLKIENRKAVDGLTKSFARSEAFRYAEQANFDRWDDELRTFLLDHFGSGWAVEIYETAGGKWYAQAVTIGRRHAVAVYEYDPEEGISSIEIKFVH